MGNEFDVEAWEERAAIIEYMGGESRKTAERMTTELLGAYLGQTEEAETCRETL